MEHTSSSVFHLHTQDEEHLLRSKHLLAKAKSVSQFDRKNCKTLIPQIIATLISTSYNITSGMALGFSAVLIPELEKNSEDIKATKIETSWIASVLPLIMPLASIFGGWAMDKWGRLKILKLSVVPGIIGWVCIATAQNVPMIIFGRILTGLFSALSAGAAIVYVTEIARKDLRGAFLVWTQTYVSLGLILSYFKGWVIHWKMMAWIVNIYLVASLLLTFLLPESPPWLISKGKIAKAVKSLQWLHKYQTKAEGQEKSYAEMVLSLLIMEEEEKKSQLAIEGSGGFREFLKPRGYKPLLLLFGMFLFQQFSGIYVFMFYSVSVFEDTGSSVNPYLASIFIGVIRLIMCLLNSWMLKSFPRRILLIISAAGMAVFLLISGFATKWVREGTTKLTWIPTLSLLLYIISSMVGLLIIPWTMTAELFPLKIRGMASSISMSFANLIMFVVVQSYVSLVPVLGGPAGIQWFFAGVSGLTLIYVFVFMPETYKKKLSEIEDYFEKNTIYICRKRREEEEEEN